jgi:hypothetical protein
LQQHVVEGQPEGLEGMRHTYWTEITGRRQHGKPFP